MSSQIQQTQSLLLNLPPEIESLILDHLNWPGLYKISLVNRHFSKLATLRLWQSLNFVALKNEGIEGDDLMSLQRRFFIACNRLIETCPERWQELAVSVRCIRLVRLPGIYVPDPDVEPDRELEWIDLCTSHPTRRTVFEVIACFTKLEELHVFNKDSLDIDGQNVELAEKIWGRFECLRKVSLGGEISRCVVLAILSRPEEVEELSCIALLDGTVGQHNHSGALLFLRPLKDKFHRLKTLHLCRMAELSENHSEVMHLRWPFDLENDRALLKEWAKFIRHVSQNLVDLTFEDSFLAGGGVAIEQVDFSAVADGGPPTLGIDKGAESSRRFRNIVGPALRESKWPRLKRATFIGIALGSDDPETSALNGFSKEVEIRFEPGKLMRFEDDVTPITISPPYGPFHLQHDDAVDRSPFVADEQDEEDSNHDDIDHEENSF